MEPSVFGPREVPTYPGHSNCIRVRPPVTLPEAEIDDAVARLREESGIPDESGGMIDQVGTPDSRSGLPFDPARPPEHIAAAEAKLRVQRSESAIFYDADGNQVFRVDGRGAAVEFSDEQILAMHDGLLTHNHPLGWQAPAESPGRAGTSFSNDDLELVIEANLAAICAITPTVRYTLDRPAAGWGMTSRRELRRAMQVADDEVRAQLEPAIERGEITIEQANARHHHERTLILARRFDWRYIREVR
jgi:hypothetical protein